jgi:hypothetical protein
MKKLETPSDTVFEAGLKEILSSDSQDNDQESESESEHQAPTNRPRLNFTDSSREAEKLGRFEVIIRVVAAIAALGLLIYFAVSVTSKM